MTVVWCDPPSPWRGDPYSDQLEEVMARPGAWALLRTYDKATTGHRVASRLRCSDKLPPGRWEFRSGQVEPGKPSWGVWARYLGDDE